MNDLFQPKLWPSRRLRWVIWGLFTMAWTVALLVPPSVVSWVFSLIFPPPPHPVDATQYQELKFIISKTIHICTYAFWAALSGWLHMPGRLRWRLLLVLSVHAFATEYCQQFVDRTGSWRDVGLDHIGVVWGLMLSWGWWFKSP